MASTRGSQQNLPRWLKLSFARICNVLSAAVATIVLAQPVWAASYQPPPNLNSYPPPSVPPWLDTGSNAWMLTAATLVGLMSLPGLAIFYGGLAKKRFVLNTVFMIFYAYAAVLVVWLLFGYNLGFGPAGVKIGNYGILGMPTPTLDAGFMSSQATIGPAGFPIN